MPLILINSKFWTSFRLLLSDVMLKYGTIDKPDLKLFEITDSLDRAMEIVKQAPVSEWWRNIN